MAGRQPHSPYQDLQEPPCRQPRGLPSPERGPGAVTLPDAELQRLLLARQRAGRVPGVTAGVARDGALLWTGSAGLADVEAGRPAEPRLQYRIGSITKTFTAAVVLLLCGEGLLDLDDRLGAQLPEAPFGRVTVRSLLAHGAGVQREMPGGIWEAFQGPDRAALLASLDASGQVLRPWTAWHYSNLGYALLGELVRRCAKAPFAEVVQERLLTPLGLGRTTWTRSEPAAHGYLVRPHEDVVAREPEVDLRAGAAHGQLWSTLADLATWAAALHGTRPGVLPAAVCERMRTVHSMADPERWTRAWGLGLGLYRRGDRILAGHGGGLPGFRAGLVFDPEDGTAAIVLANGTTGLDHVGAACELLDHARTAPAPEPPAWQPGEPCPEALRSALGAWWYEGEQLVVWWRHGRLQAGSSDAPDEAVELIEEADDRYRIAEGPYRGERVRLVRDGAGAVVKLSWSDYPFGREP
jgi:CubicO group peptidase (beta-lactamase class C family)